MASLRMRSFMGRPQQLATYICSTLVATLVSNKLPNVPTYLRPDREANAMTGCYLPVQLSNPVDAPWVVNLFGESMEAPVHEGSRSWMSEARMSTLYYVCSVDAFQSMSVKYIDTEHALYVSVPRGNPNLDDEEMIFDQRTVSRFVAMPIQLIPENKKRTR
ncbi:hypothetical protein F4677DRAFT_345758 [Hypoxylon crocopeplum]|nr:hypothetical protein F4677DRAFT_345758 [Hypoxylon crocopeplum]